MNPDFLEKLHQITAALRKGLVFNPLDELQKRAKDFGEGQGQFGMDMAHDINAIAHSTNAHPAPANAGLNTLLGIGSLFVPGLGEEGAAERAALRGNAPNSHLAEVAAKYVADHAIEPANFPKVTTVDKVKAKQMADAYESLKSDPSDPRVKSAYAQFTKEVQQQHDALKAAGYNFDYDPHDPYPNSASMLNDLRDKKTIKVFKTGEGQSHPLMTDTQNDMFRAVHDALGHGINGNQFGPKGEEQAFRDHAAMFSPEARRVMATETRGQNSWTNFGPKSDAPVTERPYAEQKAALWPAHYMGDYSEMPSPVTVSFGGHKATFPADAPEVQESMIKRAEKYYGPRDTPPDYPKSEGANEWRTTWDKWQNTI